MEDQETRRPETGQDTLPGDGAAAAREPSPGAEGKAPGGPEGDRTEPEGGGEDPRDRLLAEAREEVARLQARERLQEALLRAGALPEAIPLLCRDAQPGDPDPAGTLKARYGFLFRREEAIPTPAVAPPLGDRQLGAAEELDRMSPAEINRDWDRVRELLSGGK